MEQRAPQLATASKIFGCLILVVTLVNLKMDWLENPGFSIEEYLAISISVGLLLMAYFASKERKIVDEEPTPLKHMQEAQMHSNAYLVEPCLSASIDCVGAGMQLTQHPHQGCGQ